MFPNYDKRAKSEEELSRWIPPLILSNLPASVSYLSARLRLLPSEVETALASLKREGLVRNDGVMWYSTRIEKEK